MMPKCELAHCLGRDAEAGGCIGVCQPVGHPVNRPLDGGSSVGPHWWSWSGL